MKRITQTALMQFLSRVGISQLSQAELRMTKLLEEATMHFQSLKAERPRLLQGEKYEYVLDDAEEYAAYARACLPELLNIQKGDIRVVVGGRILTGEDYYFLGHHIPEGELFAVVFLSGLLEALYPEKKINLSISPRGSEKSRYFDWESRSCNLFLLGGPYSNESTSNIYSKLRTRGRIKEEPGTKLSLEYHIGDANQTVVYEMEVPTEQENEFRDIATIVKAPHPYFPESRQVFIFFGIGTRGTLSAVTMLRSLKWLKDITTHIQSDDGSYRLDSFELIIRSYFENSPVLCSFRSEILQEINTKVEIL